MLFKTKKRRAKALICSILILFFNAMEAQDAPAIIPPSPEAASLGKFTEVPISHYTGLPNISVPITSYSLGGKSFPVSISYHARGLKVEEIASRVGIGWALSAGGQISRQVRANADDGPYGYINRPSVLMDALGAENPNNNFFINMNTREAYWNQASVGGPLPEPDRHPDQFIMQAGSLSGKFIFDYKDDLPLIQSYDDIVIDYKMDTTYNIIDRFVVTDKDGFKYYFGVSKDTLRCAQNWEQNMGNFAIQRNGDYILTHGDNNYRINNTWSLMDVESPSGELVSFVYEKQDSEFFRRTHDALVDNTNAVSHVSQIKSHQYQLKEIIHDGGKIEFESNDLRQDIGLADSSKELDKIKIYDNNQSLVKTFELYHSYPGTVMDGNQNPTLSQWDISGSKRLRLDSIVEIGRNGGAKPPFVFTYNSQQMPNRFSNSQDLWGYYNGKGNGHFLTYFGSGNLGADRTVDTLKSMAGMLEKIKYPTGGSTKFIYEHNKGVLGPEFNHVKFHDVNPTGTAHADISPIDHLLFDNGYYSKDFTIDRKIGLVRVSVSLPTINGINYNEICASSHNDCGFQIRLEPRNNNPNPTILFNSGIVDYIINDGDYRLIVRPKEWLYWDPEPKNVLPFFVSLVWKKEVTGQANLVYTSGKRIKKIEFFDSGNNMVSNKEYAYLDGSGKESGVILSLPFFGSVSSRFIGTEFNVFEAGPAFPGNLFTTYQDNTIGYRAVTEYYGNAAQNVGKTVYSFFVQRDTGDFLSYPITPPTDNEWLRGLPLSTTHYKRGVNGLYKKVKSISNTYLYGNHFLDGDPDEPAFFPLIFTPPTKRQNILHCLPESQFNETKYEKNDTSFRLPLINLYLPDNLDGTTGTGETFYKIYHFTGGTLGNFKSKETYYDDNENPTLITETKTEFNYEKHYQPSKVTTVGSDGIPVVQTFHYPKDIIEGSIIYPSVEMAALNTLVSQNRLEVVKSETKRDGALLSTVNKLFYDDLLALPKSVQTSKGTGILEDQIIYHSYYPNGNVREVSRADGTHIVYVWGYDREYPIAKIEGASFGDIPTAVYDSIVAASNSDVDAMTEELLRGELAKLRSTNDCPGLSGALVTTYTYDPLIGMTSMTDPKGYTLYYEYDVSNRLKQVRDVAGKILSQNEYHYRGQP